MTTTHVVYDTTTGRILAAHHFRGEPADPESTRRATIEIGEFSEFGEMDLPDAQVGVVPVSNYPTDARRRYKVDVKTSTLVEIAPGADDSGVGFDFGSTPAPGSEGGEI